MNQYYSPIKTVLLLVISLLILYFITAVDWLIIIGLVLGLLGLSSKRASEIIDFLWRKLSWILSLIVPNILLTVIFYLFLTPIAFLSRVFGEKDQLNLKNNKSSLFKISETIINKEYFEKPW